MFVLPWLIAMHALVVVNYRVLFSLPMYRFNQFITPFATCPQENGSGRHSTQDPHPSPSGSYTL